MNSNEHNLQMLQKKSTLFDKLKSLLMFVGLLSVILATFFIAFIGFALYSFSAGVKNFSTSFTPSFSSKNNSSFVTPAKNTSYIAGIRLSGEVNSTLATNIIEKLETAQEDKNALAVFLEVNSPGGSVVASQEIYDALLEFRKTKPVVAYVREIAASGAYYAIASASKIIANRGSMIGSIGVILHGFEADKLMHFLKINPVTMKTGALKDTGSPSRPMNENDKKYLHEMLHNTLAQFVDDVKKSRQTNESTMKILSDGRVVLGTQAVDFRLVDALGSKNTALREIATLLQQEKVPELFFYEDTHSFSEIFAQKLALSALGLFQKSLFGEAQKFSFLEKSTALPPLFK
jgi:protease-4